MGHRQEAAPNFRWTPVVAGEESALDAGLASQGRIVARKGARHPPFLTAFLDWLRTETGRFVLPVQADMATLSRGKLRIQGVHPAICSPLDRYREINASVVWEGKGWDALLRVTHSVGVHNDDLPAPVNHLLLPEWSHLSAACAVVFTDAYVRKLAQLTPRLPLRADAPPPLSRNDCLNVR